MKNCPANLSRIVFDESHLDIGNGEEEVSFGFREDLNLALPGGLHEKFVALASKDQTDAGNDLILTGVSIKDFWIKLDCFVFFKRFKPGERVLAHQQMTANIVDVIGRVREHDHTSAVFPIKPDERVIAGSAAVVPD